MPGDAHLHFAYGNVMPASVTHHCAQQIRHANPHANAEYECLNQCAGQCAEYRDQ